MTKEEIYLDLSKLSEVEQKKVIGMLPESLTDVQYKITKEFYILIFSKRLNYWLVASNPFYRKQEITYKQFKTLINE